jgi:serine/threonine-protein kinase
MSAGMGDQQGDAPGIGPSDETVPLTPEQVQAARDGEPPAVQARAARQGGRQEPSYRNIIEGYELLKKLGEGGMGGVFLAREKSSGRHVAIKVLRMQLARDEEYVTRLAREAKLAAKLEHPNIVRAFETGESNGQHYLVMDYVDGKTLSDVLKTRGLLKEKEALGMILQVSRALACAHIEGIVHRDIKPDNIMLTADGTAKLADLGLAKKVDSETALTQTGTTMGTPDYMSPEQARGEKDLDTRSDIYSLGATLFHLVTGRPPFEGPSPGVVIAKRLTELPPSPSEINFKISAACSRMIDRMISPQRDDRQQTPQELIIEIERVLAGDPSAAARAPEKPRRRPPAAGPRGVDVQLARARKHYLGGELEKAREAYAAAVEERAACLEAWLGLVLMLMDTGKLQDAWKWVDKGLAMFRNDPELVGAKSLVLRRLGQDQYAEKLCNSAIKAGGKVLAPLSLGEAMLAAGRSEAEKCFSKAAGRATERGLIHIRAAEAYLQYGRAQDALSHLRMAVTEFPDAALVHYLLGRAQQGMSLFRAASGAYRQAVRLAPENPRFANAARNVPAAGIAGRLVGLFRRLLGR